MAHSIAQYTGTRIDSSAKHIVACKVNHDLYTDMGNTEKDLTQNKYRYAMMKDEIVLNVNRMTKNGINEKGEFHETYKLFAYPSVITTLGDKVPQGLKQGIREHYRTLSPDDITKYISYRDEAKKQHVFPYLFSMQGISVGTAYASDLSGDNVASVMIGGMATVLNGHCLGLPPQIQARPREGGVQQGDGQEAHEAGACNIIMFYIDEATHTYINLENTESEPINIPCHATEKDIIEEAIMALNGIESTDPQSPMRSFFVGHLLHVKTLKNEKERQEELMFREYVTSH
ncbi:hypothetical protein GUITHDRAFT_120148 [Guillardia theta CCMP2712]|uniref:Uncharacterized protein n=1 Tax=Guillardia theta (strain CCMP2712) TaxID=905079 RepID=L1IBL5_GUITC|nr:hypothetical protein GUITHDRAFT_120148 [Guillardia theta CCMP2712]EKX33628.1 hypothetical protein GUITHDRAFT_120148 [Guillardia theta CCMP2712]|eukprot:XP_005820608.1 hypothetical protein GUITHDRAFT_120148 [Guillardia theta CCMP2712]